MNLFSDFEPEKPKKMDEENVPEVAGALDPKQPETEKTDQTMAETNDLEANGAHAEGAAEEHGNEAEADHEQMNDLVAPEGEEPPAKVEHGEPAEPVSEFAIGGRFFDGDGFIGSTREWAEVLKKSGPGKIAAPPIEAAFPVFKPSYGFEIAIGSGLTMTPEMHSIGRPKHLIISANDGLVSRSLAEKPVPWTIVNENADVISDRVNEPLRSLTSIDRILGGTRDEWLPLVLEHPLRGVHYVLATATDTQLEPGYDFILVEQAHHHDAKRLHAEVQRLARPGSRFILWDYMVPRVNAAVDSVVGDIMDLLHPYLNDEEERFLSADLSTLPGSDGEQLLFCGQLPLLEAKLICKEFIEMIRLWPVMQRLEKVNELPWKYHQLEGLLGEVWGKGRKRHVVQLPVTIRSSAAQ